MDNSARQATEPVPRRPTRTLSRRGLTLLLATVLASPVLIWSLLTLMLPKAHDRPLDVQIELDWDTPQSLKLINTGNEPLSSLRIELNGAYAYFPDQPLAAGETAVLRFDWFLKKTGQRLHPDHTEIRTIHVSARLPGNYRAVSSWSRPDIP